jgi:circadian clock protein KaiC
VSERVRIKKLPTGVPGLDDVLGGGLPEFSFNLIAGPPGGGKTTLAHQIMFANASPERRALFIMICGEAPLKMLRYQQQFEFFDAALIPESVRFLHLGAELVADGLERVLETIVREVEAMGPRMVFVDSFRAMTRVNGAQSGINMQQFVERLSLHLTSWEATTFLVGEYDEEHERNPVFTVADGIVRLLQTAERNSVVRKVQVLKMRGQGQIPGLHTLKISGAGLRVYPRLPSPGAPATPSELPLERKKTGIAGLDEMLGGGIPQGYSMMFVGPSGSGKSVAVTQFIREGIERGEPGVIAVFERRPEEYLTTAPEAVRLAKLIDSGKLEVLYLRPLDLSVDETMEELAAAVRRVGARRLAIDSLSGLELALAPSFRDDFRESLYRMVGALLCLGVTVVMTAELVESYTELRLSPQGISFLTDAIVLQRYVEIEGSIRRFMVVAKLRGLAHDTRLHFYEIGPTGIVVGEPATGYQGLLVGAPRAIGDAPGGDR